MSLSYCFFAHPLRTDRVENKMNKFSRSLTEKSHPVDHPIPDPTLCAMMSHCTHVIGVVLVLVLPLARPGPGADVSVLARRHQTLLPEDELRQPLVRNLLHHQRLDQRHLKSRRNIIINNIESACNSLTWRDYIHGDRSSWVQTLDSGPF